MNPCNMVVRSFHTLAYVGIIKHYLSGADAAVNVGLPEHA